MTNKKEETLEKKIEEARIAPDLSPNNCMNKDAARKLGLRYDSRRKVYRDSDGYAVRDRFGQYLG